MVKNESCSKIIHSLCRELLLPAGVFRKGTSRVYLDDNGYFFTVIEFQPSGWGKGTYLNVGMYFLWEGDEYIAYHCAKGDTRVKGYLPYENDEQFTRDLRPYVEVALEQLHIYREFGKPDSLKEWLRTHPDHYGACRVKPIHRLQDREVIDIIRRTRAFWRSKSGMKNMKHFPEYDA